MQQIVQIRVRPEDRDDKNLIIRKAIKSSRLKGGAAQAKVLKRSIDARGRSVKYVYQVMLWTDDEDGPEGISLAAYQHVSDRDAVHIIGAGPAGYFAALQCLKNGLKPIVIERGKDVRSRRRDLRAIQQMGVVDPDSNYCFGEGGAGTYSDGKLYTRSNKRGNVGEILQILVEHGADADILVDAHPHIGSNKLPRIIASIRETITDHGGEIHFESRVTDFVFRDGQVRSIIINDDQQVQTDCVILATGHSARDIYRLLDQHGITLEFKPFALGVRVEHPQPLIDSIQYHLPERGEHLPAASYRLACQVGQRGVFSFCMCPGGLIVPAATAPGEIVVNGMSLSRRDSPFANAGTVVAVDEKMVGRSLGRTNVSAMDGLAFQAAVERSCFEVGDGSQRAPAQRLIDFVEGRISADLPRTSYIPGIHATQVGELLPEGLVGTLREGIREFGKRMKGYYTNDAIVVATESRTSSPVRIPRGDDTLMYHGIEGFFPCGEGAGYAGGIVSAAIDGCNVANACSEFIKSKVRSNK